MEFPQITALVPAGEHFDSSAINEGIYLTAGHVEAIENTLAQNATDLNNNASSLTSLQTSLNEANTARETAQNNLTLATGEITKRDATITTLQAEISVLKGQPAGQFEETKREKDEQPGDAKVPFHKRTDNPANAIADSLLGKPK